MPCVPLPRLSQASVPLTRSVQVTDEQGRTRLVRIPAERDLTIYLDREEVVTLMTLGSHPEWLVLGYLLNQGLIESVAHIESITVDWEVGAAGVRTHGAPARAGARRRRVVTTGCGQGSMFADLLDKLTPLPRDQSALNQAVLGAIVDTVRAQDTLYKTAGSVHACALFAAERMLIFIEDVGRHNALDTIAGWLAYERARCKAPATRDAQDKSHASPVLYTTGRLTSEMIIKSAQMGVAIVVSRSGTTDMAIEVAERCGVCAIGRALNRRFICYTHPWRLAFASSPLAQSTEPL